jgi:hypothetical protein
MVGVNKPEVEMATKIVYSRTQWAGGQGFFHSGYVGIGDHEVLYVYDCGSLQPASLTREIAEFRTRYGDVIDLLFVSHFHADHVNGLPQLLANATVRTAVVPLVSTAERLYVFAQAVATNTDISDWYRDLIVDPESAIRDIGGSVNVIVILPLEEDGDDSFDAPVEPSEPASILQGESAEDHSGNTALAAGKRSVLSGAKGTAPIWEWNTMTTAFAKKRERAFLCALATALGILLADLEKRISTRAGIATLVRTEAAALATAYNSNFPDLNLTSLLVYSGPAAEAHQGRSFRRRAVLERGELHAWGGRPGWLGTGDQRMGAQRCAALARHFGSRLSRVGTLALPHHGSFDSYHADLLASFGDYRPVCAASVGENNTYGHPSRRVVIKLSSNGNHVVVVTEHEASRWTESGVSYL